MLSRMAGFGILIRLDVDGRCAWCFCFGDATWLWVWVWCWGFCLGKKRGTGELGLCCTRYVGYLIESELRSDFSTGHIAAGDFLLA